MKYDINVLQINLHVKTPNSTKTHLYYYIIEQLKKLQICCNSMSIYIAQPYKSFRNMSRITFWARTEQSVINMICASNDFPSNLTLTCDSWRESLK